ncbi:MAG: CoA transferase [Sphingomonas sp.]|uniref:CoA transferase n=1 Tax=Sphingomonas sp. TaxID=28214 RepID=UPI0025E776B3|nr:CoA transferase [Sphingomonas sp.]MBX3563529.1 CoA transferase [Sphingomonas sp.]
MYEMLGDLRVIEAASFVAGPSCGLHLAQLGAEVIRIDQIGGGPDFGRWPVAPDGHSLYWEGLNKGKKSVAVDLSNPEGRELMVRLATAPGASSGIFLTNYPERGFLAHDRLVAHRADLITARVMGWNDGTPAVDYTINCAVGVPYMTGPEGGDEPVNHVVPAWDLLTGALASTAVLAAVHRRRLCGIGGEIRLPLSDVAIATLANLGQIGEVEASGHDRPAYGNALYGAFGCDFTTADGKRIMVVAITPRQWTGLIKALDIAADIGGLEASLGTDFRDEGARFSHRHALNPIVAAAIARRRSDDLFDAFAGNNVCWGKYHGLRAAIAEEPRLVRENPVFSDVSHPSGMRYPAPGFPASLPAADRLPAARAPFLGEHTEEVLAELLGCSGGEIAALHDRGIVASANA